jgi:hypothetical protein
MPADSKAPDIGNRILDWIAEHFNIVGIAAVVLLYAVFYVYKNWDKVKNWPGVGKLVMYFSRYPIPQADPNRFAVLVAHLENDEKHEHEHLIIEALNELERVQALALDCNIPLKGPVAEEMERWGQAKA